MIRKVDLLIIGGGPAGSSAAIRAKQLRPDWKVVVLDKAPFPRDKVCGDGLGPHAVNEIATLGAHSVLEGHSPVNSVHLLGPRGAQIEGVPPKPGYAIRRIDLDAGLVRCAEDLGVEVVVERIDDITQDSTAVTVNGSWAAPFVVAADGANSRTRRLLDLSFATGNDLAFAVRGYMPSEVTSLTIEWQKRYTPSYSWVFPLGDGTANVGFGCLKAALPEKGSKEAIWEAVAEFTGISIADPSLRAHHLPLSSAGLDRACGRILFAGDAAGLINPLSGEGIYYALATGRIAASAVTRGGDPASTYKAGVGREFRQHFRSTTLVATAARLAPLNFDAAILATRKHQVFEDLVELAIGNGVVTPAMASGVFGGWLRALRAGRDLS